MMPAPIKMTSVLVCVLLMKTPSFSPVVYDPTGKSPFSDCFYLNRYTDYNSFVLFDKGLASKLHTET